MLKRLLFNRYFVIFFVLAIWLTFFDQNNFLYQRELNKDIKKLEAERNFYNEQIDLLRNQKAALNSDLDKLEQFAREEYLMKRSDEDIYLFKEKE